MEDDSELILEDASSIYEAMERMIRYASDATEALGSTPGLLGSLAGNIAPVLTFPEERWPMWVALLIAWTAGWLLLIGATNG